MARTFWFPAGWLNSKVMAADHSGALGCQDAWAHAADALSHSRPGGTVKDLRYAPGFSEEQA
jgi:hypothetical protein